MEQEAKALATLLSALEISDQGLKREKYKESKTLLLEAAEAGSELSYYLLACIEAKRNMAHEPNYVQAAQYMCKVSKEFEDSDTILNLHAEDLTRVAEADSLAARNILANPCFRKRLVPNYLARIGASDPDTGMYILREKKLSAELDGFDLSRLAAADKYNANYIIADESMCAKLDPWGRSWIAESHPELVDQLFNDMSFLEDLEAKNIIKMGTQFKTVAQKIIENKQLYSKLSMEELKQLRNIHSS